ncbi:hypothetical protein QAD02_011749 [Eretmocerus hayati]|uniref:Uncharacterized protein n=1 Tax=Eretmocerus hayati TaxID=131215 RepID=A0ACC2NYQ3_9HYME|nr:hypothetical protein QAD02_011749 [Eretmocerus hayati]
MNQQVVDTAASSKEGNSHDRLEKLNWAVFHGHKEDIGSLLNKKIKVDDPPSSCFRSPLHSSVYSGDLDVVKTLLDIGASPNVTDRNNETPLQLAAHFERYAIVDLLLTSEKLVNCSSIKSLTHLHIACMRNRVDVVKKFLQNDISCINTCVNEKSARWSGYTPLHIAVQYQCVETVEALLSNGADIIIKATNNQATALHLAHTFRNNQIIDMILATHKTIVGNPKNSEGLSHFHIACTRNNPEILKSFIENKVSLDDSFELSSRQHTAIDFAIYYDCIDNVKLLLTEGNNIFPLTEDRMNDAYRTGNEELVNLLLSLKDRLKEEEILHIEKLPAFHRACYNGDIDAVKKLLAETPSEINTPLWQGDTPLHLAVKRKDGVIVRYLLKQGADPNIKNADGETCLHLAFQADKTSSIVKTILNEIDYKGIQENPVNYYGLSHFHIACYGYDEGIVENFIKFGVDVNEPIGLDSPIYPGYTPLHFAAIAGSFDLGDDEMVCNTVPLLLKHGASYTATDENGVSPFDVAVDEVYDFAHDDRACRVMLQIMMHHSKHKDSTFNDRGFSLLHLLIYIAGHDSAVSKDFIKRHKDDVNKAVHKLNKKWDGYTPLHFAVISGHLYHAKYLLEIGADISIKAANGDTPLHLTPLTMLCFRNPEISSLKISDFASLQHNPFGTTGYSIFHIVCSAGNKPVMKYFLKHGVDPNVRTKLKGGKFDDKTALHLVTRSFGTPKLGVVKLLLESGANPRIRDHDLNTPLHYISGVLEPEIVDILISHGVDVNARNASLATPLHTILDAYGASDYQLERMLMRFLENGADINLANERGITPLTSVFWSTWYSDFKSCARSILNHVTKLKAIGFHLSEVNEKGYAKLLNRASKRREPIAENLEQKCKNERDLMMKIHTNVHNVTLHDFIWKNLNELAVICASEELQKMINSDDVKNKFPIYYSMLQLQLRRGLERRQLLENAGKTHEFLINNRLPQKCCQKILQTLDDDDLRNIIDSADITQSVQTVQPEVKPSKTANRQTRSLRSGTKTVNK